MSEAVSGREHWGMKQYEGQPIQLFAWEKFLPSWEGRFRDTILLVHGSSMASTPTFDLQVQGRGDEMSLMDHFARRGYDVWCFDCEGYGRSDKGRDTHFYVSDGANDAEAVAEYVRALRQCGPLLAYGLSSGALRAAM